MPAYHLDPVLLGRDPVTFLQFPPATALDPWMRDRLTCYDYRQYPILPLQTITYSDLRLAYP
eukprot:6207991-Pleurochrysis_carterae.AAC.2